MSSEKSGSYPIPGIDAAEVRRLHIQGEAWAEDSSAMLDRIGIAPGWRCLDLGCGPRGITPELSARVGDSGKVLGLDFSEPFLALARQTAADNVRFVQGDAYATGLPEASFDFVHMRFLASTSGEPERLVAEAKRLLKPGGILASQEADGSTMACFPPHPAWTRLIEALVLVFEGGFGDDAIGHRMYRLMRASGLSDVEYRPRTIGIRAGDPWIDYLPDTSDSLRSVYIDRGLFTAAELDDTLAACRAHLAHPDTVFRSVTMVQCWGRKPG